MDFTKVGCDIVSISRFGKLLREGSDAFRDRIFLPNEYIGASLERLAGIFAAKEAACKALGMPAGSWTKICVSHEDDGAPHLTVSDSRLAIDEIDVSISHDGDYAFAVVIIKKNG